MGWIGRLRSATWEWVPLTVFLAVVVTGATSYVAAVAGINETQRGAYRMGFHAGRGTPPADNPFLKVPAASWPASADRVSDQMLADHYSDCDDLKSFDYSGFADGVAAGQQEVARTGVVATNGQAFPCD